jgi:hypothetical protein
MVLVDGKATKSCMHPTREGAVVEELKGLASLPEDDTPVKGKKVCIVDTVFLLFSFNLG